MSVKKNLFLKFLLLPFLFLSSGCVYIVVGGIGALGGYMISPDTVEGVTDNDIVTVWDNAVDVISIMGLIMDKNEQAGYILAKINGAKVTVNISAVSDSSVKLTVKARKFLMPDTRVAQDVFVKVMSSLSR